MGVVPRHPLVVDASVAVAWCISSEATSATDELLVEAARTSIVVPSIWWTELPNTMIVARRRGRLSPGDWSRFENFLTGLKILSEAVEPERIVRDVARLRQAHGLTAYDGTYLELARRTDGRLATLDKRLKAAARDAEVAVLDLDN